MDSNIKVTSSRHTSLSISLYGTHFPFEFFFSRQTVVVAMRVAVVCAADFGGM
jgi:hypothetical protein